MQQTRGNWGPDKLSKSRQSSGVGHGQREEHGISSCRKPLGSNATDLPHVNHLQKSFGQSMLEHQFVPPKHLTNTRGQHVFLIPTGEGLRSPYCLFRTPPTWLSSNDESLRHADCQGCPEGGRGLQAPQLLSQSSETLLRLVMPRARIRSSTGSSSRNRWHKP